MNQSSLNTTARRVAAVVLSVVAITGGVTVGVSVGRLLMPSPFALPAALFAGIGAELVISILAELALTPRRGPTR